MISFRGKQARTSADYPTSRIQASPLRMYGGHVHVLVVEDDRDAAESFAELIRFLGHDSKIVRDGGELAMTLRRYSDFGLALVDVGLPHMDGYELGTHLASLEIPVVIVTARKSVELEERTRKSGFAAHVHKANAEAELEPIIQKYANVGAQR